MDGTTTKNKSDESLVGKQGLIWIVRSHTDALGNRGADSVRIFRDTIPPGTPTFTSQTSPAIVNAAYTSPVQWAWTRISPKDSFLVSLNGAVATRQAGQTYTLSNPTNQSYMLSVVALDTAGNKSASADFTILVDRAAPPAPSVTGTTLTATPAWSWGPGTGSDGAKVYHYKLSTATTYSAETSATSYSPTGLGTGKYTLLVQERDAAGNWSVDGSLAIEVDKTGPSVAIGKPTPMGRVTSVDPVVSGVVTDDHGIKKVEYRINSATYVPASLTGGNWTFTEAYDVGVNTIWVRGEDQFGSRDSVSIKIYKYPNVVFVRKNATGKGKSWEDALGELYSALDPTNNYSLGTQIWVAAGSYGGSPGNPQEIAIYHSEMTIKGGFRSDVPATDSTMRDLANFPSILTKILFLGANSTEIHDLNFDGFTLKDRLWLANADHYRVRFGNLTLDKITSTQNILLTRGNNILFDKCIFANLVSTDDAALFLKGSVEFRGCRFENNRGNSGYSPVALGGASITIRTSYFANSMAPDGNRHFYLDYSGQNLDIQSSKIQGGKSSILLDPGFPPEQFIYSGNEDF
ncbi:MAG: hypothetical protein ABIW76_23215 [Fibrobacteria bacterium]